MGEREQGLVSRIVFGTLWQGMSLFLQSGLRFVTKLILAYLLVPEDFGLVGMAVVFTGLVFVLSEAGLGAALVQRKEDDLTDVERATAHRAAIVLSIAVYLLVLVPGAYLVAAFFGEPRLVALIWVMGTSVMIRSFATWEYAFIRRDLRFRQWATLETIAALLSSALAVALAMMGFGVWSIALQGVVFSILLTLMLKHRYDGPPKEDFSWAAFKGFISFSAFVTGNRVLKFLTDKLDYLVVGRIVGATQLGLYTLAFMLTDTIRRQIMAALTQVLFPVYSRVQEDMEQVNKFYLSAVKFNCVLVFPIVGFYLVYAQDFVTLTFGEQWAGAGAPLFFLGIAVLVQTVGGTTRALLKAIGYPELQFRVQTIKLFFITLPAVWAGTYFFGLVGATWAVILDKAVERIWYQYYMRGIVGTTERQIARAVAAPMLGLLAMCLFYWWSSLQIAPQTLPTLLAVALAGAIVYLGVTLPLIFGELRQLIQQVRAA